MGVVKPETHLQSLILSLSLLTDRVLHTKLTLPLLIHMSLSNQVFQEIGGVLDITVGLTLKWHRLEYGNLISHENRILPD